MEISSLPENVATLRLFGSFARNEQTENSDYDILVVLKRAQIVNEKLQNEIYALFEREVSISWYSKDRISTMYKMGHLFAWHIYLESKELLENDRFFNSLGVPEKYNYSLEDVWSLLEILNPIRESMIKNPRSLVYELGLVYVCSRNIAICALPSLANKFTFSVKAPFDLEFPLSDEEFEILLNCRYASTRGFISPKVELEQGLRLYDHVLTWGKNTFEKIKLVNNGIATYKEKV